MTRVLRVNPDDPDLDAIDVAARELRRGGLVAFPTETVYGLGVDALNATAVARMFRVKGRPSTDPVIVHVADVSAIAEVAKSIPDEAVALALAFWPGALTMILHKQSSVPDEVTAARPTVGVRVPSHPVARRLLQRAAIPVAAPSANRFAKPSPTRAEHVLADFEGMIDVVLDSGPTPIGVESTVLDLTVSPPLVRRPGGVSLEALRGVIPDIDTISEMLSAGAAQPAPGQLERHYAPHAPLTLYVGGVDRIAERMADDARSAAAAGSRVGILAPEEDLRALAPRLAASAASGRIITMRCGARRDRAEIARDLFRVLRELDAAGVDVILASAPEPRDIGVAVIDRLTRAAEGRVFWV